MNALHIQEHVPLAPLTTIGIGGPARYFLEADSGDRVLAGLAWAKQQEIPVYFLGGGSNLLFADDGFDGLVIQLGMKGWDAQEDGSRIHINAAAGEPWDPFVGEMVAQHWAGLECLSGIPGLVGATPIQNVGAYGQEVSESIEWVDVLDLHSQKTTRLSPEICQFGYRTSAFKTTKVSQYLILAVGFCLRANGAAKIAYRDLSRRVGAGASLATVRETVLAIRREKSMVVEKSDPNSWSCGSFFTNPILSPSAYQAFCKRFPGDHPRYPAENNHTKLPAAWLIEQAGFKKGHVFRQVGLSEKHSLALVNKGKGTAAQVLELAQQIRTEVWKQFGVTLEPEPVIIGSNGSRLSLASLS